MILQRLFDDTQLPAGPLVIAGPCSAESREQVLSTAHAVAYMGVKIFRAGVWKPRTMPGGFEGVGEIALEWLREVKTLTGMLTAVEVATGMHVKAAIEGGVDMLWIGARTTTNPFAMQEIADTLQQLGATNIPVLVKNPVNPDLELWIGALQRLNNAGVQRLAAIHRGFSAYGAHLYRNMPQWYIPIELRRRVPGLPIINDPSHIAGKRDLVGSVARQALDMGFDGLIVECHCNPDEALSDKYQQLTPPQLEALLHSLVMRSQSVDTETLQSLRKQIDELDNELLEILAKRMAVACEIGHFKKEHSMPVLQSNRYDDLMERRVKQAELMGMAPEFMHKILSAIHEESVRQQLNVISQ